MKLLIGLLHYIRTNAIISKHLIVFVLFVAHFVFLSRLFNNWYLLFLVDDVVFYYYFLCMSSITFLRCSSQPTLIWLITRYFICTQYVYLLMQVTSSVQTRGSEMTVKAQFVNMYQVSCSLPRANTGALIRVSNDGASTSNNQYFHLVFDSTCFDCAIANVTLDSSCNRKVVQLVIWCSSEVTQ